MMGGLAYMTGPPGRPLRAGASVIDIMGGSFGVIGIITALYERRKTGRGRFIQASLYESTAFLMGQHMAYAGFTGKSVPPMPARVSAWAVYSLFESKDGEMVFVGITSDQHWQRFCETFDRPDLAADDSLLTNADRVAAQKRLIPELQRFFKTLEKEDILRLCEKAGIPHSLVAKPHELFDDPQLNEGGSLVETTFPGGNKVKLPKLPLRMDGCDFALRSEPPAVGEGSLEVLKSIGLSEKEINELNQAGIIGAKA
jgi:crotonobetainyl-CoA:carnitine CoA-transferase CaiB-like acyl-CoA transferase